MWVCETHFPRLQPDVHAAPSGAPLAFLVVQVRKILFESCHLAAGAIMRRQGPVWLALRDVGQTQILGPHRSHDANASADQPP